jgi:hypothetical protein
MSDKKGAHAMYAISDCTDREKLRQRREEIKLTLEFLAAERLELQRNERSVEPEAFRRRMRLFDRLTEWYRHETAQIDNALADPESSDTQKPERIRESAAPIR